MSQDSNTIRPTMQATEVAYELHTLGWKAFQNLCVTVAGDLGVGTNGSKFF